MAPLLSSIQIIGAREASGRFGEMHDALQSLHRARLRAAAEQLKQALSEEAPRSTKAGPHYADSFLVRVYDEGAGSFNARVTSGGPHGWLTPLIVEGTRPHPIFPKRAGGWLAFQWDKGPRGPGIYFFRRVNHPGTRPNDFPARAFARVRAGIMQDLGSIAAQAIAGIRQSEL